MKRDTAYTRHLRRSKTSALVSLFAMALQILFALEHASAMAVAAAKGGSDGTPMGILEICTARGLLRIPAPPGTGLDEQQAPRSNSGESCAVCGTAAISGSSDASACAVIVTFPHLRKVAITPPVQADRRSTGFKRSGSTRGPPSADTNRTI